MADPRKRKELEELEDYWREGDSVQANWVSRRVLRLERECLRLELKRDDLSICPACGCKLMFPDPPEENRGA